MSGSGTPAAVTRDGETGKRGKRTANPLALDGAVQVRVFKRASEFVADPCQLGLEDGRGRAMPMQAKHLHWGHFDRFGNEWRDRCGGWCYAAACAGPSVREFAGVRLVCHGKRERGGGVCLYAQLSAPMVSTSVTLDAELAKSLGSSNKTLSLFGAPNFTTRCILRGGRMTQFVSSTQ